MVEAVRILSAEKEFFALEKMIAAGINCKNNEATLLQICLNLVAFFFSLQDYYSEKERE